MTGLRVVPSSVPPSLIDPRIGAAAAGDRRAAHSPLRELLPRVRNLVRYMIREDAEVDDIAQQVMLSLMRGFKSYRGEGSIGAWTDRITAREAIRHMKKVRRRREQREAAKPDLVPTRESQAPGDYFARREAAQLLDTLPESQRAAMVMHHIAGMSVPEVAATMDVSFDTAKSRLRIGMKKLRQQSQMMRDTA